jgi:hypothetical protein
MKTLKISLFVAVLGLTSFAALPAHQNAVEKTAKASISWKSESVEVGEIPQGTPKAIEFEFKNTGDTTVLITNVQPSCGCTAADYTKTPIKPGETGTVKAIFNAAAKGTFAKTVKVTTNAEETVKVLTFKGKVV